MGVEPVLLGAYISMVRDVVVTVAAVVTACVAIHGLRVWKRDLVGKEFYEVAKALVYQSHAVSRASEKVRFPIAEYERMAFTKEQDIHMTEGEKWRVSEAAAYRKRLKEYSESYSEFYEALLKVRVVAGSNVYVAFRSFQGALTRPLIEVNNYLALLDDFSVSICEDSSVVHELRGFILIEGDGLDDFTIAIGEAREEGESFLLPYLHRKSIGS